MDQLNYSCPVDRPPMKTNEPNILVKCLHVVLKLISSSYLEEIEKNVLSNCIEEYKVLMCIYLCLCVYQVVLSYICYGY